MQKLMQKLTFPAPIQVGTIQVVVDHVEFGANRCGIPSKAASVRVL